MDTDVLKSLKFRGELRPSQREVVDLAQRLLGEGRRKLHIVAPPGSGKTVLGLYLWAEQLRCPALVLSPNSAIQAQWAARTSLFDFSGDKDALVSTDSAAPGLLTSLTYQSVTLPSRGNEDLDAQAVELWIERLVSKNQAKDPQEATVWINDLKRHNRSYYDDRLGGYRKQVRDQRATGGNALDVLHGSSLKTLERLRDRKVGLIILDECHHLMGHWGRVLADASEFLEQPVVIGLTATPPDRTGIDAKDIQRYDKFFGPIDYEVPVPAVVKDGYLAPYQDLAYFVRPTAEELTFIASADDHLHQLIESLCDPKTFERPAEGEAPIADSVPEVAPDSLVAPAEEEDQDGGDVVEASANSTDEDAPSDEEESEPAPAADSEVVAPVSTPETLPQWLLRIITERRLPSGAIAKDWHAFERRDPEFAQAARLFLLHRKLELPKDVPPPLTDFEPDDVPEMNVLIPVLDRFVRHRLRRSSDTNDHALAARVINRLRTLGVQITETGSQPCASPVGRVMAYSRSKTEALAPILKVEMASLGEALRAVIVADYEKTSAVTAEVSHLLDDEAGGAIAAFKALVRNPETDVLDPVLVTGSSVLLDDDVGPKLIEAAKAWLKREGYAVELSCDEEDGFHVLNGQGADWCPRVYVEMITEIFQQGVTRCLVGTRGLLGEGWDASKINVLIDMTTVTTAMSVNQLRGRSIRLDSDAPEKLANNWDVVCIAPEFTKGLDDYTRFIRKHATIFGITDDSTVEKGVGHVHPAFTELKPEGVEDSVQVLNADMLQRAGRREQVRGQWKIGEPYAGKPIRALDVKPLSKRDANGFPPFEGAKSPWNENSLVLAVGEAVLGALQEAKLIPVSADVHVGQRAGGYVRAFLENADEENSKLFAKSVYEVFAPLTNPRYVIPRKVDRFSETFLSRLLPDVVGRHFRRRKREMVLLHAVPSEMAKKKSLVSIYQRYWNAHVSPGVAVFALRGQGAKLLESARQSGQVPRGGAHEKDVFV